MTRLTVVTLAAVGLILFLSWIGGKLIGSRSRGLSIRMQVFLALAWIVGAFAFGLGLLVIDRVESRAQRLAEAAARDEALALSALLESEFARTGASLATVASQLNRFEKERLRGRADPLGKTLEPAGLELMDPSGKILFPERSISLAEELGAVFVDVKLGPMDRSIGTLRVVKPTIVVQALLADFAPTVLVISLILGAAAALSAAFIGRSIAAPIEALSEFARKVSLGERTKLPLRVSGREVTRLVESIDSMKRQLEGRPFVETFSADLSHELKNPVAAIRASAEVLVDGALDEPDRARRFVERIQEAVLRIEHLVSELLDLAAVETRGTENLERLDLKALVTVALSRLESAGQTTLPAGVAEAWVRGDATWLQRAISNLLQNAIVHASDDPNLTVELRRNVDTIELIIENSGAIAPHVQASLFRRFVTTRRNSGGTGLGLSIVRAVAEAHGGTIELLAPGPPRVAFRLSLPAA